MFDLNFISDFFYQEGEPYDADYGKSDKPASVWQAIHSMPDDEWEAMAKDLFPDEHITAEKVMDMVRETNTCSNLTVPVEVWIDSEGRYTFYVWE